MFDHARRRPSAALSVAAMSVERACMGALHMCDVCLRRAAIGVMLGVSEVMAALAHRG